MKKFRRFSAIFFVFMFCAILFGFTFYELTKTSPEDYPHTFSHVFYQNQTGRGFTWCTGTNFTEGQAQIIRKTDDALDWRQARNLEVTSSVLNGKGSSYSSQSMMIHKTKVENLLEGETYLYRVGAENVPLDKWISGEFSVKSDDYYFNNGLNFFHVTDTQAGDLNSYKNTWQKTMQAAFDKFEPDFILHTGDITDNNWSNKANLLEFHWAHDILNKEGSTPVLMTSTGNHDSEDTIFNSFYNFAMPETATGITGSYGSYDIGNAHFVNIDTNESGFNQKRGLSDEQIAWIDADLAQTDADFIIMQTHKGLLSYGKHHLDNEMPYIRNQLMPLLDKYDVDLFLNGHDHIYSRTQPVTWNADNHEAIVNNSAYFDTQSLTYEKNEENFGTIHISLLPAGQKRELLPVVGQTTSDGHTFYADTISYLDGIMDVNNIKPVPMPITFVNNTGNNPIYFNMDKYCMFSNINITGGTLTYDVYIVDRNNIADIQHFDSFKITKNTNFVTDYEKKLQKVADILNSIPKNITLDDRNQIIAAREVYDSLTQEERVSLLTEYGGVSSKLFEAENQLYELEKARDESNNGGWLKSCNSN